MILLAYEALDDDLVAGIDVGTSKVTVVLFSLRSGVVWRGSVSLSVPVRSCGKLLTQRPEDWEEAIRNLFSRAAAKVRLGRVVGLAVSATTPTLLFLDDADRVMGEGAVLWCDPQRKGLAGPTNAGLQKVAAIFAHTPAFRDAACVLDSGNYLCFRMTGERSIGAATASQKFRWSQEHEYDCRGFDPDLVSRFPRRVVATGEVVGPLRPDAASGLGLRPGIPVVAAAYDSVAGILGGGIGGASDTMLLTAGTSFGVYMVPPVRADTDLGPWVPRLHLLPDGLFVIAGGFEAGLQPIKPLLQRLRLTCQAAGSDEALDELIAEAERREPAGCFALPFGGLPLRSPLPGRVLPTAVFSDRELVPSDTASVVALRRGVAYFARYCLDDLISRGLSVGDIHVIGGGTQSRSFCQLFADACGRPVRSFGTDAAATGAAILAASAGRTRQDRERLVAGLCAGSVVHTCDRDSRDLYDAGYFLFCDHLRTALRRAA